MSQSRRWSPRLALVMVAAFGLASVDASSLAQSGNPAGRFAPRDLRLTEPVASRVYQRDINGRAEIPIVLDESLKDARVIGASVTSQNMPPAPIAFVDGKLTGVPVGGPYTINCLVQVGQNTSTIQVNQVFVGDVWILAGQSNMEGVGDLVDVN